MMGALVRGIAWASVLAAASILDSSAHAMCPVPAEAVASPAAAAAWLLAHADRVGFAVVTRRENVAAHEAETLDMLYPLKGPSGPVQMDLLMHGDSLVITEATTSFGVPTGTIVFAALSERHGKTIVSECVASLFAKVPRNEVLRALGRARRPAE
jgi:hypothetical protein